MTVDVLDCTLRDGGHHNDWYFCPSLVDRYLAAVQSAGVRYVEMGYRTPQCHAAGSGPFRFCPEELLRESCEGLDVSIAVMIETKMLSAQTAADARVSVARILAPRRNSVARMVRVASSMGDIGAAARISDVVRSLGYDVTVNLMRSSTLTSAEIAKAAGILRGAGATTLYIADSFGGLLPDGTRDRVAAALDSFGGRVGFHAHDNMGLALANSLAAIDAGATMIDASVCGMGRGGGNLKTEQLLLFLQKAGRTDVSAQALFEVVTEDFQHLQAQHNWGPTIPFMMAGFEDIHPDEAEVPACR